MPLLQRAKSWRPQDASGSSRHFEIIEALIGFALVALGLAHLRLLIMAMSSTGLWHDEIVSVELFSSQGLWTSLTTYPAPNNHIFFNAITSLLPWSEVYSPAAARFWSFVATLSLAASGVWAFAQRRSFIEAGILIHLLLMSHPLVSLSLQARGYGLLALFAMLSGLLAWRHEQNPNGVSAIIALGVVSWLGMWTMPSYVLFAGPMMALTALSGPKLRNVLFGIATVIATLIVYLPVLPQVIASSQAYGTDWGHQLDTVKEVAGALRLFLFDDAVFVWGPNDVAIALLWIALAGLAVLAKNTAEARAARTLVGSSIILIAMAYLLGTPPPRVLLPCLVAFSLAGALVLRDRLPPDTSTGKRALVALVLGIILIPHDARTLRRFEFIPRERWKGIAEFIEHSLPEDMHVAVPFRANQLMLYTNPRTPINVSSTPEALASGRSAFLLNGLDRPKRHVDIMNDPGLATIRFKQNRGRHQSLYLSPPLHSLIKRLTVVDLVPQDREMNLAAALDRDLETRSITIRPGDPALRYIEFQAELEPVAVHRSLFLVFDEETTIGRVRVAAHLVDGSTISVPETQIFELGSTVVANLTLWHSDSTQHQAIKSLTISIRPHKIGGRRTLLLREIWVYPARLAPHS